MQPNLGGRLGDAEPFGDLPMRQILELAELDDGAQASRKLFEGAFDRCPQRGGLCRQARVVVGIRCGDVFDHRQGLVALTAASTEERRGAVRRDAVQPRGEAGVAAEASKVAERPHVGVLHDVGGIGLVAGELDGETVDIAVREPDELIECTVVAIAGPVDERGEFGCCDHEGESIAPSRAGTKPRLRPAESRSGAAVVLRIRREHLLHDDHIEPPSELAPDLALEADLVETGGAVERDRCRIVRRDTTDHGVESVTACSVDQRIEQGATHAVAVVIAIDVDGVLDRGVVRGTFLEAAQRPESDDLVGLTATNTA